MDIDSETFKPVTPQIDINSVYTDPILLRETSVSRLYRVSKAGKYFIIKTTKDNSGMSLAMLKREYEMSISLNHYHIPYFFTYEPSTPVGPGIIMEYVDGRTLNEFLAEKPSLDSRRRVFYQILDVVAYIHKSGIIHNDLKPENILISRVNDDVKLLDFGLSDNDAHYLAHSLGCTPQYASPELLKHESTIDARSDIYSLGRIMQRIFGTTRYASVSYRCVAPNPDDRYDNVDQLKRHWHRSQQTSKWVIIAVAVILLPIAFFFGRQSVPDYSATTEALRDSLNVAQNQVAVHKAMLDSIIMEQTAVQDSINARRAMQDSICNEFENFVDKTFTRALSAIKNETNINKANEIMWNEFHEKVFGKMKEVNFGNYDPEMTNYITTNTSLIYNKYTEKIESYLTRLQNDISVSNKEEK